MGDTGGQQRGNQGEAADQGADANNADSDPPDSVKPDMGRMGPPGSSDQQRWVPDGSPATATHGSL